MASSPESMIDDLTPETFDRLRQIILYETGISLADTKLAMVSSRLRPRLVASGLSTYCEYTDRLVAGWHDEMVHLATAMTTNYTSFYREAAHFEAVTVAYRGWVDAGHRRIRLWCAGCSSGEEAYTLAMTILEALPETERPSDLDVRILATDISARALEAAAVGKYPADTVEPIPAHLRARYLTPIGGGVGYAVGQELRDMIIFRRLNLTQIPFALKGSLDLIMCRNVMIYFDRDFRGRLVSEYERLLRPDGYLIVSHSETLVGVDAEFRTVQPAVYARTNGEQRGAA